MARYTVVGATRLSPFGTRNPFFGQDTDKTVKTVGVTRPYLKELREWYRENAGKTTRITRPAPPEIRDWSTTVPCTDWEQKDWCDENHKER